MKTISASTFLARRAMTRAVLWVALTLVACSAWAQPQPNDLSLTMTDAVNLALKQNPDVQIANLTLAAKQQERAIARSELLPHAGIASSESITRHNLKALVGFQLPGAPHNIGPYQAIHAGLTFSTPIFDLTLLRLYQASKHRIDAQLQDTHSVREQTTLVTISEYAAHLRAIASVKVAESRVELATRLLTQAGALKDDGVASRIDVSRADVRLSEEKQRLIDAQAEQQTTLFALTRILNVPDSTRLRFTDEDSFFSTPALDIVELNGEMGSGRRDSDDPGSGIRVQCKFQAAALHRRPSESGARSRADCPAGDTSGTDRHPEPGHRTDQAGTGRAARRP